MNCAEKLVILMQAKKDKIAKVIGVEFGEMYFNKEDAEELLGLPEEKAEYIYARIKADIADIRVRGLVGSLCPFCYIVKHSCRICKYATRHGGCKVKPSDYVELINQFIERRLAVSDVLSNKFYKDLIKEIEKQGGLND